MKKLLKNLMLVASLTLFSVGAKAQLLPISLGLKGGINTSNTSFKDSKARVGYNVGLSLDVNLPANWAIFSGLELTTKGGNIESAFAETNTKVKTTAMYLQVPVKLGYRIKTIPGLGLHFGAGPYFAQGIGGKMKYTGLDNKEVKMNTFGDGASQLKKFDYGLGVEVGATVLGLVQLRIGYDFGLADISQTDARKIKNRNFYASAGIKFF